MATVYPHLARAPITEAVLDIRIQAIDGLRMEQLEPFTDRVITRFPNKKTQKQASIELPADNEADDAQIKSRHQQIGLIFFNEDRSKAVQVQLGGFTFNQIRNYDRWERLRAEAMDLWQLYVANVHPTTAIRLGLRYINSLSVPIGKDFSEFFQTRIELGQVSHKLTKSYLCGC